MADEPEANWFLYEGPSDPEAVSCSQQDPAAGSTGQSTKIHRTKPNSRQSYPGGGGVRKAASAFQHPLADIVDRMIGRETESERFPNSARTKNGGTNPTAAPVNPTQADSKDDSK